ncbi:MAG TPA: DEAD/DEAH box helicase, partial [Phycisphaerales bacterium]|nr:DEAD/DEAH box helicase [Phycisphaerales bacterium]
MAGGKVKWTDSQIQAIETTGRDVLVTASAGTGKTAVLSERCAQLLADTKLASASEIVVLTFTEAAAEEMLSRIAETLRKKFLASRDVAIRHQLLLLDAAHISTIHAFCKRIITENFHTAGVDPAFRIIDEDEKALLKSQILDEVVEEAWADDALSQGLDKLLYRRNVQSTGKSFLKTIIEASSFLDSVASADDFFERAQILAEATSLSVNALAEKQKLIILEKLQQCRSQVEYSMVLDAKATEGGHWAGLLVDGLLAPICKCITFIEAGNFELCAKVIRDFPWKRFTAKPKHLSKDEADAIKMPAVRAIKIFKGLKDLAVVCDRYDEIVGVSAGLQTKVLIELVKRFDRKYRQAKKELNCLDFADLEHKALQLLSENAAVAESLRKRFKYIFVDEYQDINAVQQAILDKIQSGDNTFVVGDIKQSIYAFRQAKPGIFLDRLKGAGAGADVPLRVDLSDNFRSRAQVLDFVNMVFAKIMTEGLSSIEYDERSYLKAGFEYEPAGGPFVEMYILDEEVREKTEDDDIRFKGQVSAVQRQASFIAERIKRMVGGAEFKIYDKDADIYRPVEYGDIVILMRSPSNRAAEYVEVFEFAGIAVSSQNCSGYFEATEISDCLCLMKMLDNPRRDIELAAVLRSPFFRVSDTQLAMIRKFENKVESKLSFYDRVAGFCEQGSDKELRDKLCGIFEQLDTWRKLVRRGSIADVLWRVLRDTGYLSFVSALPNGKQRRANLLKMHDRAIQFEGFAGGAANQSTSLGRFVEFIEKLLEHDKD